MHISQRSNAYAKIYYEEIGTRRLLFVPMSCVQRDAPLRLNWQCQGKPALSEPTLIFDTTGVKRAIAFVSDFFFQPLPP
jgi:hypothetical protein